MKTQHYDLSKIADSIIATMPQHSIAEVKTQYQQSCAEPVIGAVSLQSQFVTVIEELRKLSTNYNSFSSRLTRVENQLRARARSTSATRGQQEQNNNKGTLCFFHQKYKTKARKCNPPCSWVNKTNNQEN